MAGLAAVAALVVTGPPRTAAAATDRTVAPVVPPLESTVLTAPMPGFVVAPAGPTNGPLTATEFASQSSDPQQAEEQFAALSAQPGFGSFIRLWTDRGGSGSGANDLAVLLFRIPGVTEPSAFANGLAAAFHGSKGTTPFTVPSIPGAQGYSIQVSSPVAATEQVVVFQAGHYVSMIQLASATSASNPTPLTTSQAITVGYEQFQLLRQVDPGGTVPTPTSVVPPYVAPLPGPIKHRVGSVGGPRSEAWPLVALIAMVVLVLAVAGSLLVVNRRRSREDPWGPDGIFAAFGALDTRSEDEGARSRAGAAETGPSGDAPEHPVRSIPSLVPSVEADSRESAGRQATPVRT